MYNVCVHVQVQVLVGTTRSSHWRTKKNYSNTTRYIGVCPFQRRMRQNL